MIDKQINMAIHEALGSPSGCPRETSYTLNVMNTHTTKYFDLSDIATVLGVNVDDLAELVDGGFAASGDTDVALVNLPKFLGLLEESDEETVMEALWDIIGTEPAAAAEYFVNLTA